MEATHHSKDHIPLSASGINESVRLEKVRLLYSNIPINILATLVAAGIVAYTQTRFIEHSLLINWIIFLFAIALTRIGLYFAYQITPNPDKKIWETLFAVTVFITGGIWASAIFLLTSETNIISHVLLAVVIMAIAAGSMSTLSYQRMVGIGFLSILMIPLILRSLTITENEYASSLGIIYLVFYLIIFIAIFRFNKHITENIIFSYKSINDTIEVNAAKEQSEQANTAKSIFLSSMSHELRTPMNAIMGFAQIMQIDREKALTQEQKHNLSEIMSASEHLLLLIDDILELSHLESGGFASTPEMIDVDDVVNEALPLVFHLMRRKNITLALEGDGQGLNVFADPSLLRKIIFNLLCNAIKYNHQDGNVIVTTEDLDDKVKISITDTGKGINNNDLSQLFTPFNRLDIKHNVNGVGIGLSLSKRMIEVMNGEIGVESKPGKGSTFWITVPKS